MSSSRTATPAAAARRRGNKDTNDIHEAKGTIHDQENETIKPAPVEAKQNPPWEPTTVSKTTSVLQIWAPTLVLIFGGCCSNVYTLESLIQASPSSGPLITAFQFLLVALATAPRHFSYTRGWRNLYLRERAIPLRRWIIYTAYFLSINILNNMAFKYQISIPLHIILRSAGPVTTMAVGRVWGGKRYPAQKIVAVVLLFGGVVLAAISDAWSRQVQADVNNQYSSPEFEPVAAEVEAEATKVSSQAPGFALLASALLLSACMGLYADDMYATYGRSGAITAETLFYSHAMSLPYFASQTKPLLRDLASIAAVSGSSDSNGNGNGGNTFGLPSWFSERVNSSSTKLFSPSSFDSPSFPTGSFCLQIPRPVLLLLLNATTQLLCIVGVNRLSAQSSSLTVSIVLNIRKLASLMLSIWLFGNTLPLGVLTGAAVVFIGGGLYALPAKPAGEEFNRLNQKQQKQKKG